ncbi:MAG: GNAT family N-acetyltransferase [Actinomycetota bacterium]|nr:GNAT family N-acetyltransferase [Actinomycetota bacterium]
MQLRTVSYDHPDAQKLVAEVQQEYVRRYGEQDDSPIDPRGFAPPLGTFVVGYLDGDAIGCGGWRSQDCDDADFADGDAEIKRMYVAPSARGRGLSRLLLAELERSAVAAGRRRMVLETGTRQPEAISLYSTSGYLEIATFGEYRCWPYSRCFGKILDG